ncbi:hypothetical protein MMC13_007858 [Lambiella insularis]|nr:hypothetical protein [Lambiella insularis]
MAISIIRFAVVLGSSYQPEQSWLYFWNIIEFIIAILIVCLASFRALFAKQSRKVKIPDSGDSRKGLLHGSRSGLKVFRFWSPSWISRSGRSTGSSGSKTKEKSNYSNGPKISQEQIMPLNRVYIRNEFETSSEARPRDWVV